MQFNIFTAAAVMATAVSAAAVPSGVPTFGGPGPVLSGGGCVANDASALQIAASDCQQVIQAARALGDKVPVTCNKARLPHYTFPPSVKGSCKVTVESKDGAAQCTKPTVIADALEQILNLCGSRTNAEAVVPCYYTYFGQGVTIKVDSGSN